MDYLRTRGFSDRMIDQFQIGYAPDRWDTLLQFLEKRSFDLAEMEKGGLLSARGKARVIWTVSAAGSFFRLLTAWARPSPLPEEYSAKGSRNT